MLKNKGFILIEAVIASVIAVIMMASFVYISKSAADSIKISTEITRATISAKNIMEELRALPYDIIFAYNKTKFDNGNGTINIEKKGNDAAVIRVKNRVELVTIRSKY